MTSVPRWERVGATVHCAPGTKPDFVRDLLRYLEDQAFDGAPRLLGVDEHGRDIVTFSEGFVAPDLDVRRWRFEQIEAAFKLLRAFHDVTAGSLLAGSAEVVCHNDFTPQNVVFRDGRPAVLIDWEFAAPGSRRRDLAHGLWQWLNIGPDGPPVEVQGERIKRVLDVYGFPQAEGMIEEIRAREAEWLQLAIRGAGATEATINRTPEHWASTAAWVKQELAWLDANAHHLLVSISA